MAKKSNKSTKVAKRSRKQTWSTYVHRSLKQINKSITISGKSMKVMNSFVNDLFDRIATEAATLARVNKKKTLGSREVQTAVRLVLPTELAKHAMAEGARAVSKTA
jgi:histone H2B